ncbi:MAG: glycogen/starch synthase [Luteolibacter sp.]
MSSSPRPRILVVTPEITYLPEGMGNLAQRMCAKAGGLADVSASLVKALYDQGADVHVALPNYRRMFHLDVESVLAHEYEKVSRSLPEQRIHLAEDRVFYHRNTVYGAENHLISLAFQREVINHTIPQVRPDLIHCNDWMTGLIPAVAKRHGIPSLFTVHNIHSERRTLRPDRGPGDRCRGLLAAPLLPPSAPQLRGKPWQQSSGPAHQRHFLRQSRQYGQPDLPPRGGRWKPRLHPGCDPQRTPLQVPLRTRQRHPQCAGYGLRSSHRSRPSPSPYDVDSLAEGKRANKLAFQAQLGLKLDPDAPLFFWPSRLDPVQKGCQLLTDILYRLVADHSACGLQIAVVASGAYQNHFQRIVAMHGLQDRVAVRDFNETLSHLGYAASDFIFMPSSFEPCGLPQMIAPKYGSLTIAHDTGGLHDTVEEMDATRSCGNDFLFFSPS